LVHPDRDESVAMQSRGIGISLGVLCGQAVRALLRHKTRSALNALGIMIGIAAVCWVVAIGRAGSARAEEALRALGDNLVWVEAGSRNINGLRNGAHGTTTLTIEDAQAIARDVPELARVSPQIDGTVILAGENRNWSTRYRGVSAEYLDIKRWTIAAGGVWTDDQVERAANVCLIGETVRQQLFGSQPATGQVVRVAGQPFEVLGVLGAKGQTGDGRDQDDTIFVPYTTAQRKLRAKGIEYVDDVLCSAVSPEAVEAATARILQIMRERHRIGPDQEDDFNIRHPEELIKAQIEANNTFSLLLVTIASVSLLVGGIGIMNVMLASVVERTREIGVRLAIGAPEWAVQAQFLAEAVMLSLLGGILGVTLSIGGASVIGKMLGWALTIPMQAVIVAVGFAVVVGMVFGFVPARRASRLDPIAALRDE
jgi:putative ABC transport system permease protein